MIEKIHIIVALFAALAITILSLYQDVTFYVLCIRLVIVIPAFYILGALFRLYLKKLFAPPEKEEKEAESAQGGGEALDENASPQEEPDLFDTDEDYT